MRSPQAGPDRLHCTAHWLPMSSPSSLPPSSPFPGALLYAGIMSLSKAPIPQMVFQERHYFHQGISLFPDTISMGHTNQCQPKRSQEGNFHSLEIRENTTENFPVWTGTWHPFASDWFPSLLGSSPLPSFPCIPLPFLFPTTLPSVSLST